MAVNAPAEIMKIFDSFIIHHESFTLNTELGRKPKAGRAAVRALDGFVFMKNGNFVYPQYKTSDPAWWNGVVAYGYIAALTSNFRFFIWAGQWDEDFEGKHLEVVRLDNLEGICKEPSPHWRSEQEEILWLETKAGFSYALLEPAVEYDQGKWVTVTDSWTSIPGGSQNNPAFTPIARNLKGKRPTWWVGRGSKKTWDYFIRVLKEEECQELAAAAKRKRGAGDEAGWEPCPQSKSPVYIEIDSDSDTNKDSDKSDAGYKGAHNGPAKKRARAGPSTKALSTRPGAQATQLASSTVEVSWTRPQTFRANQTGGQNKLVISVQMTME